MDPVKGTTDITGSVLGIPRHVMLIPRRFFPCADDLLGEAELSQCSPLSQETAELEAGGD